MMQITTDKNGYVENFAVVGKIDGGVEVPDLREEELEGFWEHCRSYRLEGGSLVLDEARAAMITAEDHKNEVRRLRERECFPVINRGSLWYDRLTPEQTDILNTWYQAWLDAPQTGMIPETPAWMEVI